MKCKPIKDDEIMREAMNQWADSGRLSSERSQKLMALVKEAAKKEKFRVRRKFWPAMAGAVLLCISLLIMLYTNSPWEPIVTPNDSTVDQEPVDQIDNWYKASAYFPNDYILRIEVPAWDLQQTPTEEEVIPINISIPGEPSRLGQARIKRDPSGLVTLTVITPTVVAYEHGYYSLTTDIVLR